MGLVVQGISVRKLRIVLIKPSKYEADGSVQRFKKGYMPNATLYHIASLTPARIGNVPVTIHTVDEYIHQDLDYLHLLRRDPDFDSLVALVGVQSHQLHRALDLAAYALEHGVNNCVIGGPHAMTCDTSDLQGRGVSFALAEAELVWQQILEDTLTGELRPVYGREKRWAEQLPNLVITPPKSEDLARYGAPVLGLYPVRGCPYRCNFCSVIKISGRAVRSPNIESTLESMRRAKHAGVRLIKFVSDNFNKFPQVRNLLNAMIDEGLGLPFYCQCDAQIAKDPDLVGLLGRAGCYEMFVGVESFNRKTLKAAGKQHNHPEHYEEIVRLCNDAGIRAHFSNILGFPDDDEAEIQHHLDVLKALRPRVASFYILTPIPGTEQYDDFRATGRITEQNLDRFDGSCSTWEHPQLSGSRLVELLYQSYTDFYGYLIRKGGLPEDDLRLAVFCRYSALHHRHPMAGGIDPIRIDDVTAYIGMRRKVFDVNLAPMPASLKLNEQDEAMNRRADWRSSRQEVSIR